MAKMIRDCKVNANDYKSVLQSDCYVDKSLLIKDFLANNLHKHVLFVTVPGRFGKTINMDMLKTFLEIQDRQKPENLNEGCNLFRDYNLNIYKYKNSTFFNSHCGRYPVIYFSYKSLTGNSYADISDGFRYALRETCLQHKYLLKSNRITEIDKMLLSLYIGRNSSKHLPDQATRVGFYHLSEWLYSHFRKEAIVLIDDYDAPYWQMLNKEFPFPDVLESIHFIYNYTSYPLFYDTYIDRVLIHACLRFSGSTVNARYINRLPFLGQHRLNRYYGLTSEEVKQKLNYFKIKRSIEDVEYFYAGYNVIHSAVKMYNTWSVMNYLQTEVVDDYWVDPNTMVDLEKYLPKNYKGDVKDLIAELLEVGNIQIKDKLNYTLEVMYLDIVIIRYVLSKGITVNINHTATFMHFLLDNGYFTATARDSETIRIKIPNEELHHRLFDAVTNNTYFKEICQFDPINISKFPKALNSLGMDKNNTSSLVIFRDSVTNLFHNNKIPDSEIAFQGYIYNVIKSSEMFILTKIEVPLILKTNKLEDVNLSIKEKKSQTNGIEETVARIRVDIMTTREKDGAGIVIETRRNRGSAEEALAQIVNVVLPNYDLFDSDDYKNKVKEGRVYIGLHLNTDTSVVTACCLVNDTNIRSRICV